MFRAVRLRELEKHRKLREPKKLRTTIQHRQKTVRHRAPVKRPALQIPETRLMNKSEQEDFNDGYYCGAIYIS